VNAVFSYHVNNLFVSFENHIRMTGLTNVETDERNNGTEFKIIYDVS
jgi:hypothetical protein